MSDGHKDDHGFLKGRALDLVRLDPPVRRIVFTTGAVLLAIAIACALRENFPGPAQTLPDGFVIPLAVILIAAVTATFALSLLVTGAAHARTRWRYVLLVPLAFGLAAVLLAALDTIALPWPVAYVRASIIAGWVFPAALLAMAAYVGLRVRIMPLFRGVFLAALLGTAAIAAVSLLVTPAFGASFILYLAGIGAVALEPALFVVGFDLADIGADATALAANALEKKAAGQMRLAHAAVVLLAFAACALLFCLRPFDATQRWIAGGWVVAIGAAAAFVMLLLSRRNAAPAAHASPQYHYLLLVAALITVGALIHSFSWEPLPGYYSASTLRSFSFVPPAGLAHTDQDWPPEGSEFDPQWPARAVFAGKTGLPMVAVIGVPRPPFSGPHGVVRGLNGLISRHDLPKMPVAFGPPAADGWARMEAGTKDGSGRTLRYAVLRKQIPTDEAATDADWYIICGDVAANIAASRARCETLAPTFLPQARQRHSQSVAFVLDLLFFAAAAGTLALAAWRSRKTDTAGLDFMFWVLFLNGLRGVMGYLGGINQPFYDTSVSMLLLGALMLVVAIAALAMELLPRASFDLATARRIAARATASLVVLCVLFLLYVFAIQGSDESQLIRGVIICFALLWELLMSGERLNLSAEHHLFSRASRLFILIGYLLLVATVVFLMTGLTDTHGQPATGWNSELFVANGLVLMGGALILNRAMRSFARLLKAD